jgi:hypothetical protein
MFTLQDLCAVAGRASWRPADLLSSRHPRHPRHPWQPQSFRTVRKRVEWNSGTMWNRQNKATLYQQNKDFMLPISSKFKNHPCILKSLTVGTQRFQMRFWFSQLNTPPICIVLHHSAFRSCGSCFPRLPKPRNARFDQQNSNVLSNELITT